MEDDKHFKEFKKTFRKPEIVAGMQIALYILLIFTTIIYGLNEKYKKLITALLVFIWTFFLIGQAIQLDGILNNNGNGNEENQKVQITPS